MYEDTYTKYDPKHILYGGYMVTGVAGLPYTEWDYGDTVKIKFDFTPIAKKIDLTKFTDLTFNIYNFRHHLVVQSASNNIIQHCCRTKKYEIELAITLEMSKELIKGNYWCEVIASNERDQLTLINSNDCLFHVR